MKYPPMVMEAMDQAKEGARATRGRSQVRYQKWTMGERMRRVESIHRQERMKG